MSTIWWYRFKVYTESHRHISSRVFFSFTNDQIFILETKKCKMSTERYCKMQRSGEWERERERKRDRNIAKKEGKASINTYLWVIFVAVKSPNPCQKKRGNGEIYSLGASLCNIVLCVCFFLNANTKIKKERWKWNWNGMLWKLLLLMLINLLLLLFYMKIQYRSNR